jgi:hypothetical protein
LTIKAGAEVTREALSADFSVCLSGIVPDVVGVDGSFFPCGVVVVVGCCDLRGISSLLLILGDQGTVVTKFSGRSCCCCYCSLGRISGRAERLSSDARTGSGFLELLPGNFTSIVFQKSDCSRHRRQMVVKTKRDGGGVPRVPGPLLLLPSFCCVA